MVLEHGCREIMLLGSMRNNGITPLSAYVDEALGKDRSQERAVVAQRLWVLDFCARASHVEVILLHLIKSQNLEHCRLFEYEDLHRLQAKGGVNSCNIFLHRTSRSSQLWGYSPWARSIASESASSDHPS